MAGKREKPEEIASKLRQVEVLQRQGETVAEAMSDLTLDKLILSEAAKHRADGPETNDALTIKLDHPMGARH